MSDRSAFCGLFTCLPGRVARVSEPRVLGCLPMPEAAESVTVSNPALERKESAHEPDARTALRSAGLVWARGRCAFDRVIFDEINLDESLRIRGVLATEPGDSAPFAERRSGSK
jgi:hypothetical protein